MFPPRAQANTGTSPVVHFEGEVRVRLPDRVIEHAHAELVGGRSRYSVGARPQNARQLRHGAGPDGVVGSGSLLVEGYEGGRQGCVG